MIFIVDNNVSVYNLFKHINKIKLNIGKNRIKTVDSHLITPFPNEPHYQFFFSFLKIIK